MSVLNEIAKVLRKTDNLNCLKRAETLEADGSQTGILNLRNLGLNPTDAVAIADILKQDKINNSDFIQSISFSYNNLIADGGAIAIIESLPLSISEIGLVDCGIGDEGGIEILNWMRKSTNLQMICAEQNNFSDTQRKEFMLFKNHYPRIMVDV